MKRLLSVLLLLLATFLFAQSVHAVGKAPTTPAGTLIEAQASAGYIDSANQRRTTTSNLVVTVVKQVYGVALTPDGARDRPGQTRRALPGSTVDLAYTIRNTGNGRDRFYFGPRSFDPEKVRPVDFGEDANCNGRFDSGEGILPLLDVREERAPRGPLRGVELDMGESVCVVLKMRVESDVDAGDVLDVDAVAASLGSRGRSIDTRNSARIVTSDAAVMSAFLLGDPATRVAQGETIEFVLNGTNVGGSAARAAADPLGNDTPGILLEAEVPAGLSYEAGSLTFEAGAGRGTPYYYVVGDGTAGGSWTSGSAGSGDVRRVGVLLEGDGAFFTQGADYRLSYAARVSGEAATPTQAGDPLAGREYVSRARVHYREGPEVVLDVATVEPTGDVVVEAAPVTHRVQPARHVEIGPYEFADASYTYAGNDIERDVEEDRQVIATVYGGNTIAFRNTVRNMGNVADTYTLRLDPPAADWACGTYHANGATPTTTVGPIAPLEQAHVVVRCTLSADAYRSHASAARLVATSTNDAGVTDATSDGVGAVLSGYGVRFEGTGSVTATADAGDVAIFELDVTNTGENADTFSLLSVGLDFGFAQEASFRLGCGDDRGTAPVAATGLLEPGETVCVTALFEVPADAVSAQEYARQGHGPEGHEGLRRIGFAAVSSGYRGARDTAVHYIEVNHRGGIAFGPDRSGTVTSPGVIDFEHVLRNTGNTTAIVRIIGRRLDLRNSCRGCVVQFAIGDGAFSSANDPIELKPGSSAAVTARLTVPSGEPIGRRVSIAPRAEADYGLDLDGETPLDRVAAELNDLVDVIGGELRLTLDAETCVDEQAERCRPTPDGTDNEAEPGEFVAYDIRAENLGTGPLAQVVVTDPLPAFTRFVSVEATAEGAFGTVLYSTDGESWFAEPITSLRTGESVHVAVDVDGDGDVDTNDTVPVAGAIDIRLVTQVQ